MNTNQEQPPLLDFEIATNLSKEVKIFFIALSSVENYWKASQ